MYLKGYQIKYEKKQVLNLPKWDFGGDKPHTNRIWNEKISKLRSLPESSYPISVIDLDKDGIEAITLINNEEFENWMKHDFDKKD